nr:nucleotidyl transferase AbiEii/AbiGii toxin family protein [Deltaproteobacteria bacterium]
MGSSPDRLDALQRGLIEAFFARTQRFFLTGGAALTGFYLRHRTTKDLDLFAPPEVSMQENHFGAVVVDPMREIAANKVGALLDRFEARDLVDLKLLLGAGLTLSEVLQDAQQKHAGADPATLAWVLGTWRIPPTAALPEDTTAAEIEAFRDDLVRQLALLALPKE